jgi:hypothetical protein
VISKTTVNDIATSPPTLRHSHNGAAFHHRHFFRAADANDGTSLRGSAHGGQARVETRAHQREAFCVKGVGVPDRSSVPA